MKHFEHSHSGDRVRLRRFPLPCSIKFGGTVLDRVTLLNVRCHVEDISGKVIVGFGSMPLGNVWAYPSAKMTYDQTLAAMKALVDEIARIMGNYREFGHPIDITHDLEPIFLNAVRNMEHRLALPEPIPVLATLVAAGPFDAALHDAYGKSHGLSCYATYGPEFLKPTSAIISEMNL